MNRKHRDRRSSVGGPVSAEMRQFLLGLALLGAAAGLSLGSSRAGEEALYEPLAPPGSAFVRVFNASPGDELDARLGDQDIADIAAYAGSAYVFLPAGRQTLTIGAQTLPVTLAPDVSYTAVYDGARIQMVEGPRFGNRLKAHVSLYNLLGGDVLSLKTADGMTPVLEGVAPGASAAREVNAVKVNLAVYEGATKLGDAKPIALERGKSFSLFVAGSKQEPVLEWVVQ